MGHEIFNDGFIRNFGQHAVDSFGIIFIEFSFLEDLRECLAHHFDDIVDELAMLGHY